MADLQDTLFEEFQQIQGAISDSTGAWSTSGGGGGAGSGQRDTAPRGNVDALGDQTGAVDYGGSSPSSGSSSSGGGILNDVEGVLAGGMGIVPLGLELASIFGGGPSPPPPLTRYAMPDSIGFVGSTNGSSALGGVDFSQTGQPRSYGSSTAQMAVPSSTAGSSSSGGSQGQPIQITVQAMDSQSFMDRSDDIASAVQKAMSNLHPIVDTISNL